MNKHTLYITRILESTHGDRVYYSICICGNIINSFPALNGWYVHVECHKCEDYYNIVNNRFYIDDRSGILKRS